MQHGLIPLELGFMIRNTGDLFLDSLPIEESRLDLIFDFEHDLSGK